MVIQNNIPGLNSRRLYNKNNTRLSKSLEKLSSGYAINRAADDAAGLAVSEKMRSQIVGMKQSVKNCQDGISLIQTFEGALDQTVTIIKRMKTLADQSANGIYDNYVDRSAIEIEYLQLCDETDHIAGTDFNGVVMLNGMPDDETGAAKLERAVNSAVNGSSEGISSASAAVCSAPAAVVPAYAPAFDVSAYSDAAKTASVQAAAFAAPKAGGTACGDFTVYGNSSDFSFDVASGVLTILGGDVAVEGTGAPTTNTIVVAKDKSANVTLRNVNIDVSKTGIKGNDNNPGVKGVVAFNIEDNSKGNITITLEGKNVLRSGVGCAGLQKNCDASCGTLTINGDGSLYAYGGDGDNRSPGGGAGIGGGDHNATANITINSGDVYARGGWDAPGIGGKGSWREPNTPGCSNITITGGHVRAWGGSHSTGIGGSQSGSDLDGCTNIIISGGTVEAYGSGGAGIGSDYGVCRNITISGGVVTAYSTAGRFSTGVGIGGKHGGVNIIISGGTVTAIGGMGTHYGESPEITGGGAGIGGGGDNPIFGGGGKGDVTITGKDTVVIAKGGKGAKNIGSGASGGVSTIKIDDILTKEGYNGNGIVDGTIVHYTGKKPETPDPDDSDTPDKPNPPKPIIPDNPNVPDDPDTPNGKLTVSIPDPFKNAAAKLTYTDNLILQAGARTKDSVRFTFRYSSSGIGGLAADLNCTAKGLGLDTLTLKTQESANFAVDRLDCALNKVSMIRATFGAAQNRLEHKIDDLNNTTENLTSAESVIRDTDMAKEMMNFTKNQILTQSAQSMLAQANSLPQQVMSLIGS